MAMAFCNTCGKSYVPNSKTIDDRCLECIRNWSSATGKYCITCGQEIPRIPVSRKNRNGKLITVSVYTGYKYCSECKDNSRKRASLLAAQQWQKSNPEKVKAHILTRCHPDQLVILYECPCEVEKKYNHHHDYTKPMEVIRLCHKCHRKEHARLRSLMDEAI